MVRVGLNIQLTPCSNVRLEASVIMLTFVCLFNLLIALINLYIAWRVWKLRRVLANFTHTLTKVERTLRFVLVPTPVVITKGQIGTQNLSDRHQKLTLLLKQIGPLLTLLGWSYTWQRRRLRPLSRIRWGGKRMRL